MDRPGPLSPSRTPRQPIPPISSLPASQPPTDFLTDTWGVGCSPVTRSAILRGSLRALAPGFHINHFPSPCRVQVLRPYAMPTPALLCLHHKTCRSSNRRFVGHQGGHGAVPLPVVCDRYRVHGVGADAGNGAALCGPQVSKHFLGNSNHCFALRHMTHIERPPNELHPVALSQNGMCCGILSLTPSPHFLRALVLYVGLPQASPTE